MRRLIIASLALGACLAVPRFAEATNGQGVLPAIPTLLTLVDGRCGGPQLFRDRYGYCRPKAPPPPRYYRCRPGFRPTPYGCRPIY